MRAGIQVGIALCWVLTAFAQPTSQVKSRPITLQECCELALARNLDIQIDHISQEIAKYNLGGAYGAYSPLLSFTARRDFLNRPGNFDAQKSNPDFPYNFTTDSAGPTLIGKLPTGLDYELIGLAGENVAMTDYHGVPGVAEDYFWGVRRTNNYFAETQFTIRQNLLRDFWIDQDRLNIKLLKKDQKISEQAFRFRVAQALLAVELAYHDLFIASERVKVQEKTLETQNQLLAETKRRVSVGDLPPLDAEQVETQVQNTLQALSMARESHASQQNALKGLISENFNEWLDVEIEPTEKPLAIPPLLDRAESFHKALKKRPDLEQARLAVERQDATVGFRLNQLYPSVDFIGRYGGLGVHEQGSAAIRQATSFRNPVYYYGVVVSYPLGNLGERNSYRASKAAKKVAELQLKKAEQAVLLQVADWIIRVQSRHDEIAFARKAREYAEAAVAAEIRKLKNGLSTSFIVLQLQETLTTARVGELAALAEYQKALAQLAFAEGSTLERHQFKVDAR